MSDKIDLILDRGRSKVIRMGSGPMWHVLPPPPSCTCMWHTTHQALIVFDHLTSLLDIGVWIGAWMGHVSPVIPSKIYLYQPEQVCHLIYRSQLDHIQQLLQERFGAGDDAPSGEDRLEKIELIKKELGDYALYGAIGSQTLSGIISKANLSVRFL